MKILIITQYFWPENFKINDLSLGLKQKGHEVTVLTGKPNYPTGDFYPGYNFFNKRIEKWNGIKIYRSFIVPRKSGRSVNLLLNYLSFAVFACFKILCIKGEFDRIFIYQPSPVTVGLPGIVAKKKFKAPIYFWVQDLWPASISAASNIKNKNVLSLLNKVTKFIYHHSKIILVQSNSFIPYIINQGVDKSKLIYYPNSTESFYKIEEPSSEFLSKLPEGTKLMFAGNIGESQSFDTLIDAAKILKSKGVNISWIVIGEGRMKGYVQNKIIEKGLSDNFILLGTFPSVEMPQFFSCCDALIVSLKKNPIFSLTIPSKLQSYMACGKPVIASLDGEGARIVIQANAGYTSSSEDSEALSKIIVKFLNLSDKDKKQLGMNSRKYFENEFERELLLNKLESLLTSV